jgi:4-amino-4-deoxy-L-arabinose transferase-like glycosyltransferase
MTARKLSLALAAILIVSAGVRLYHIDEPIADALQAKQAYTANKARNIARAPMNPLRDTLDFLDPDGGQLRLAEEVPVYSGLLALGYRLLGERHWMGHALSLVGTLAALAAFFDLARREWDDRAAIVATILLSASPLLIFYGRAVLPDPWMLAGMLASAACYRRYLDDGRRRWIVLAALAGLGAALFKYFGLIVLLPLAEMARRKSGTWRAVFSRSFVAMSAVMGVPIAAWMVLVFFRTPNPIVSGWMDGKVTPYLILQDPGSIATKAFWSGFFARFLMRDCGPVTGVLMISGVVAATLRKAGVPGFARGWTVMGLTFYVLFAPKVRDHDYYEMMLLPAAALWATMGLRTLASFAPVPRPRFVFATLALAIAVQSPWASRSLFRLDRGKIALAGRLDALCPPDGRVVAIGPGIEFPIVVHHSRREGWPVHSPTLPADWRSDVANYRAAGADLIAVYFEPKATAAQRASYEPMLRELPLVEHRIGPRTRLGGRCEFFILGMGERLARR